MQNVFKKKIRKILANSFQRELLDASIDNLKSDNKLRFNNFAYSLRELSRHFLKSLAPDLSIEESIWFKNETKKQNVYSRGERIIYSIQGGLEDKFVEREIMSIKELNSVKKKVTDSIEILNKYTHINDKTFDLSDEMIMSNSELIMKSFIELTETIINTRKIILKSLEDKLSKKILEKAMWDISDEVDILATHHWMENVNIDKFHIIKLENRNILIQGMGSIEFLLQWGSNGDVGRGDGHQMNETFPFKATFTIHLSKKINDSEAELLKYEIDTSRWY
jgi:hypothetical protein